MKKYKYYPKPAKKNSSWNATKTIAFRKTISKVCRGHFPIQSNQIF